MSNLVIKEFKKLEKDPSPITEVSLLFYISSVLKNIIHMVATRDNYINI